MIRHVVFDMGQVLIRFDRDLFIHRLGVSEADGQRLLREVFLSTEWVQMDWGTMGEEEALQSMCTRLPAPLHEAAEKLVTRWDRPLLPIEGMYELVEEMNRAGYGVYLLSNAGFRQHEYWPRIPCARFFKGTLISCDVGSIKPERAIYEAFLQKFQLAAEECFFVDDQPINVEGARRCGMPGAVFHGDAGELRQRLRLAGVQVQAPEQNTLR